MENRIHHYLRKALCHYFPTDTKGIKMYLAVPPRATTCCTHTGENTALSFQNIKSSPAGSLTEPAKASKETAHAAVPHRQTFSKCSSCCIFRPTEKGYLTTFSRHFLHGCFTAASADTPNEQPLLLPSSACPPTHAAKRNQGKNLGKAEAFRNTALLYLALPKTPQISASWTWMFLSRTAPEVQQLCNNPSRGNFYHLQAKHSALKHISICLWKALPSAASHWTQRTALHLLSSGSKPLPS